MLLIAVGALDLAYPTASVANALPATTPVISGFTPESGAPGTAVNIYGTNLFDVNAVSFNGLLAAFSSTAGTNVLAVVPTNSTTGPITLYTAGGKTLTAGIFTVTNNTPPRIGSFTPLEGAAGSSVEIRGTNLTEITAVEFNGISAAYTMLVDVILAIVPTNAVSGPISVKSPLGVDTTREVFTVVLRAAPVVTGFSPIQGESGTSVEISGANFSEVSSVKFNGTAASFRVLAGSLFATVPSEASSGPITVTTPAGTFVTAEVFTVTRLAAPVITGFSPVSGGAGTSVRILGTNLTGVRAVKFNGVDASFLSLSGSLSATVPASSTTGPLTVITAAGTNTTTAVFTVTLGPAPVITSFSPAKGEVGTTVEIRGLYLRDVIAVKFNDSEAVFTNSLFRPLSATVPLKATSGPITVVTAGGSFTTTNAFTVEHFFTPVIQSISPSSGAPGSIVDIRGANLTGVTRVDFKGVSATFLEFSTERLFAYVPATAQDGPITVSTRFGAATSTASFMVIREPVSVQPPVLSIRALAQNRLELSWPAEAEGFILQTAETLATPWTDLGAAPTSSEGRKTVVLDLVAGQRFYRLFRP